MCGRFTLKTPLGKWLFEIFGEDLAAELPSIRPRYNIAPTQSILIARRHSKSELIQLEFARWGFLPAWAKEVRGSAPLINARSETLATKPTFRTAFKHSRCAVIADGYYEWQVVDKKHKQPFWIHRPDQSPFLMAALATTNQQIDPTLRIQSVAIVTTASNKPLSTIHDRMPVVLDTVDKVQRWLTCGPFLAERRVLAERREPSGEVRENFEAFAEDLSSKDFSPAPDDFFKARPVSSRVGSPKNEDPQCLDASPVLWQRTLGIDEPVEPDT